MKDTSQQVLSRAFELIENEKLEEAQALLQPLLETDRDNPDVWWVYAHAVTDPTTAKDALNNVLRLEPIYPGAAELLETLELQSPSRERSSVSPIAAIKEPSFLPDIPSTVPDLPALSDDMDMGFFDEKSDEGDEPDFEDDLTDSKKKAPVASRRMGSSRLILIVATVGIVLVILLVGAVLLSQQPAGQPGTVADNPTMAPTEPALDVTIQSAAPTQEEAPTIESQTAELPTLESSEPSTPTVEAMVTPEITPEGETGTVGGATFDTLIQALSAFTLADSSVGIEQTALGETLVVNVCAAGGAEGRAALTNAMLTAANAFSGVSSEAEGLAVRLLDCASNTPVRTIGATTADVLAFSDGSLTQAEFQALWRSV